MAKGLPVTVVNFLRIEGRGEGKAEKGMSGWAGEGRRGGG